MDPLYALTLIAFIFGIVVGILLCNFPLFILRRKCRNQPDTDITEPVDPDKEKQAENIIVQGLQPFKPSIVPPVITKK